MFLPLLVGAAVSGAATVGALVQHYRHEFGPMSLAEARALATMPVTAVADAREGLVKLVGALGCDTPVRSLYGDSLAAVREVHHYAMEGSGLRAARRLARVERTEHGFWLDDGTGRVALDPARCRIDFESEGADAESMIEEHRLRVGERVAVIGRVRRVEQLAQHPMRQHPRDEDRALQFLDAPLVTWRTEPEVFPKLRPPVGGVALSAGSLGMAVVGALLRL
jgi:hypothetical protein